MAGTDPYRFSETLRVPSRDLVSGGKVRAITHMSNFRLLLHPERAHSPSTYSIKKYTKVIHLQAAGSSHYILHMKF